MEVTSPKTADTNETINSIVIIAIPKLARGSTREKHAEFGGDAKLRLLLFTTTTHVAILKLALVIT